MLRAILVAILATQGLFVSGALTKFDVIKTEQTTIFECHSRNLGDITVPVAKDTEISDILFDGCIPKTSYADFLNERNFTIKNKPTIRIHNLFPPLKSSYLKNLTLHFFELKNVTLGNDFIEDTAHIDTLIIDECILPKLPENNEIKNIALKNGASVDDFGGCKNVMMIDFYKWKVPDRKEWLAGCKNLLGLSVSKLKENEVKSVLDGLTSLKLFEAVECGLTSLPSELNSNVYLTQIGLGKNNLVKIGDSLKSFPWMQSILLFEDNLDLEDFAKGLESLEHLLHYDLMNYKDCPKTFQVNSTANVTEVRIGDVVELTCWIDTSCLHLLQWHHLTRSQLMPFYWSTLEPGTSTFLTAGTQSRLTVTWPITNNQTTMFICRALLPSRVVDAPTITLDIVG